MFPRPASTCPGNFVEMAVFRPTCRQSEAWEEGPPARCLDKPPKRPMRIPVESMSSHSPRPYRFTLGARCVAGTFQKLSLSPCQLHCFESRSGLIAFRMNQKSVRYHEKSCLSDTAWDFSLCIY